MTPTVTASNPRLTSTSCCQGIDVDIRVEYIVGEAVVGGVTLAPDGEQIYNSWGGPDNWLSDTLLALVQPWPDATELLGEFVAQARAQIIEHWSDIADELDRADDYADEDDDQCEF